MNSTWNISHITASIGGKIGRAMLTEGNLVNAGGSDPLLTTIVSIDPIYVDFNVDERRDAALPEIGAARQSKDKQQSLRDQQIVFHFGLDTEEGFPHEGHLVFADNTYAKGTGTILVRGVADNPDGRLIPGSRVRVRVPVSDKYSATLVPDTAVNTDQDQKYLLIVGEGNVVKTAERSPRAPARRRDARHPGAEVEAKRVDHCRRHGACAVELSRRTDP